MPKHTKKGGDDKMPKKPDGKGKGPAKPKPKEKPKVSKPPKLKTIAEAQPSQKRRAKKKEEDKMPGKPDPKGKKPAKRLAREPKQSVKQVLVDEALVKRFAVYKKKIKKDEAENRRILNAIQKSITRRQKPEPRLGASSLDTSSGYSSAGGFVRDRGGGRTDEGGTSTEGEFAV